MNGTNQAVSDSLISETAHNQGRGGFTLIELLVVISTVAILSVLLLPAFANQSKDQSAFFQCANNLKQLGMCLTMYSDGYQDYYPAALDPNGDWIWPPQLRRFSTKGVDTSVFNCPNAAEKGFSWISKNSGTQPAQYGYFTHEVRMNYLNPTLPIGYGYNLYGSQINSYRALGVFFGGETKESQVVKPSAMIAIGDNNSDVNQGGTTNFCAGIGGWSGNPAIWPLDVHGKRANLVFCDGHVQAMKRIEIIPDLAPPTNLDEAVRMWNYDNGYHFP